MDLPARARRRVDPLGDPAGLTVQSGVSGWPARFAASGLAILFGVQAAINMAVNLQLIPAKGMTLPFISYGGSSIISLAYGVGMMLALTRQRPRTEVESMNAAGVSRGYA